MARHLTAVAVVPPPPPPETCSFCGKFEHEVEALVAGPCARICDGCVELCAKIVAEKQARARAEGSRT